MYKRFRDSLVFPELIINFRKDHFIMVLLYMLLFATMMTLPMIIDVVKFDQLPLSSYNEIKDNMYTESFDCDITNYVLNCDSDTSVKLIDNFRNIDVFIVSNTEITFDDYKTNDTVIVIHEDEFTVLFGTIRVSEKLSYFGTVFDDIDFKVIEDDFDTFSHNLIKDIEDVMLQTKVSWSSIIIASYITINLLMVLFISLLVGYIIKRRWKTMPYKQAFRMGTYVSSTTFLALVFMNFIGQELLIILVIVFMNSRQIGRLTTAINQAIKK